MPQFYAYIYRDPSRKNEPIYVGKGQDDRAYKHLNDAQNNHFKNRLDKMKREGVEPIINVVDMPSEALAFQCEVDAIARFGRKDLGKGPLLNLTDGGEGTSGYIPSAETRKKKSVAMKGKTASLETRKKQSEAHKGKPKSLETRAKMSDAHKGENNHMYGKSPSVETRQKQSEAMKGKPKSICPHCGKLSARNQWHFDNCKQKRDPKIPFD